MNNQIKSKTGVLLSTAKGQKQPDLGACKMTPPNNAAMEANATTKRGDQRSNGPSHKSEVGVGLDLLRQIQLKYKGNPIRQAAEFSFYFSASTGNQRMTSIAAQSAFRADLIEIVRVLRCMNMPIQNLTDISCKQMRLMFVHLEKKGTSIAKLALLRRTIRNFGIWAGKPCAHLDSPGSRLYGSL